ncbi:NAD(P)/FAD-dependent oxidoreductase [Caloranaerobacter azorensis]|uniref:NAD(P)/FAD-dependent oxidoreductase n=1 Tax=Caloranaerobacter azorensis TaxID=116090 RepID=A0A6P1YA51_9FIRM|nr:NAD(P)/FAD-dependent oxidoreductase [Caloranaerobacter azorensis]QIB26051.1 NAD(P)/FAD-dependent oxidoreductase [Caloranaerobacter azorensis]
METVAVIGAGPAGILAAGTASKQGRKVFLFERNSDIGKKLLITGNGRCNITNKCDIEDFIKNIVNNNNFMYSALYAFTNIDTINLLESFGVQIKTEKDNRCFPKTDKSIDIIKAFYKYLISNKVTIFKNTRVKDIILNKNDTFTIYLNNKKPMIFNKVILATGGKSYPQTGSTGDGYIFAHKFGHTIIEPKPALVPIKLKDAKAKKLQGLSLNNVKLTAYLNDKKIHEQIGEIIFTHFGISGPVTLSLSSYINRYPSDKIKLEIDFLPDYTFECLESIIKSLFIRYHQKNICNTLCELLPKSIINYLLDTLNIPLDKKTNSVTRNERHKIISNLKRFRLIYDGLRNIEHAIVTSGGISTKEINPSTMESKLIKGLFFAGEIIDVDALTGGFNIQIALSTGYLAGLNC